MIEFDSSNPNIETVRRIIMERLRREPDWHNFEEDYRNFEPYVELIGNAYTGKNIFICLSNDVLWQLVYEGILALGHDHCNLGHPWFHHTEYGKKVIESETPPPNDPTGYLESLSSRVESVDPTVQAYLMESLTSFRTGNLIASSILLGVASERVFLLLCDSMKDALSDDNEERRFERILRKFPMKPKLDWMHGKIQSIQAQRPEGLPENTTLMITTIYELLRKQRNEHGHPREKPPSLRREDMYINLQVFPRYYETAEAFRAFLSSNSI